MKLIKLSQNMYAKVDEDDFKSLSKIKWYASKGHRNNYYAKNIFKRKSLFMHRYIMKARRGQIIDHINGDTLDNRRSNLRLVTPSQNNANQRPSFTKTKSQLKGVYFLKNGNRLKKWYSRIQINNKDYFLGYFLTENEAYNAYRKKHIGAYGKYSYFSREKDV